MAGKYGELKNDERRNFYENLILQKFPGTRYDEQVLYERTQRALRESWKKKGAEKKESLNKVRDLRRAYLKRPEPFDEDKLGDLYFALLNQIGTAAETTDEELEQLINGSLKYKKELYVNVSSGIADVLINGRENRPNSKFGIAAAEKYAYQGLTEAEAELKNMSADEDEYRKMYQGNSLNTLGSVLMKENKLEESEKVLLQAQAVSTGDLRASIPLMTLAEKTNQYLAELYTEKKDFERAEEYYLKNSIGNDYEKILYSDFYKKRYGKTEGFEDYYLKIKDKIKTKLRERILSSRYQEAKDAVPFNLKTVDGKIISYENLRGKIIVINVWGTWCAPCVAELPELQQLYKKYESDQEVAILTIDFNDEIDAVKKFITDKNYEFPVMMDNGYIFKTPQFSSGSVSFPTTYFIDKQGKVAFVQTGNYGGSLAEEFSWRIEALKQDRVN